MKIFETHAHYDDPAFDTDRDSLLSAMQENGIERIVNIGADVSTSRYTVSLTEKYDFIYGAVGIHPNETSPAADSDLDIIRELAGHDKILAIGEIGLDYHYDDTDREKQHLWFVRQLNLAKEKGLPVVIHSRDAAKDTVDIMKAEHAEDTGGVIHCFSYSKEMAKIFLDMGFYIGIGGVLTFKNAVKLKEVADYVPLERIVLETDSPYLAPVPYRAKRNNSTHLPYVAAELAAIKGISAEEVAAVTYKNAEKLYRLT